MDCNLLREDQFANLVSFVINNTIELRESEQIYTILLNHITDTDQKTLDAIRQLLKVHPKLDLLQLFPYLFQQDSFKSVAQVIKNCPIPSNIQAFCDYLRNCVQEPLFMKVWGFVLVLFGSRLHRTVHLNTLLQLAEQQFNSTAIEPRCNAFQSWKSLIVNFGLLNHLAHIKRLTLILVPIWNSMNHERNVLVLDECLATFAFLAARISVMEISFWKHIIDPSLKLKFRKHLPVVVRLLAPVNNDIPEISDWQEITEEPVENVLKLIKCVHGFDKWSMDQYESIVELYIEVRDEHLESSLVSFILHNWESGQTSGAELLLNTLDGEKSRICITKMMEILTNNWNNCSNSVPALMEWTIKFLNSSVTKPIFTNSITAFCSFKAPNRTLVESDINFITKSCKSIESLFGLVSHPSPALEKLKELHSRIQSLIPSNKLQKHQHKFEQLLSSKSPTPATVSSTRKPTQVFKRQKTEYVPIPPRKFNTSPLPTHNQLVILEFM